MLRRRSASALSRMNAGSPRSAAHQASPSPRCMKTLSACRWSRWRGGAQDEPVCSLVEEISKARVYPARLRHEPDDRLEHLGQLEQRGDRGDDLLKDLLARLQRHSGGSCDDRVEARVEPLARRLRALLRATFSCDSAANRESRLRASRHRIRSGRAKGRDSGGKARPAGRLVERRELGGVSVNWGTIPSKTLREAIVYLTGIEPEDDLRPELPREGGDHDRGPPPRTQQVIEREVDVVRNQLLRNHVQVVHGSARFVDSTPSSFGRGGAAADRREIRHRHRHAPGAPARRGLRREDDPRFRRPARCSTESRSPSSSWARE